MSRYLTPSKLGLLCLVYNYTDGLIPTSSTVPTLSFFMSHLLPLKPTEGTSTPDIPESTHVIPIETFAKALDGLASVRPGKSVWDVLLDEIWSIDCNHSFHQFFETLPSLLAPPREEKRLNGLPPDKGRILLHPTSPMGAFVRRAQLEFTRLQFHDEVSLWKSFVAFRFPTWTAWMRRYPSGTEENFIDNNLEDFGIDSTSPLTAVVYGGLQNDSERPSTVSIDDVERLLEFQVGEMQRLGGRVPREMKTQLRSMLDSRVIVPSLSHYVNFLDSWRAGDYPSSFDSLHRYFDYTMQNRRKMFYQYALLNLAILQANFGCYSEAVAAMQEAISTAREHKDMKCLNFCLSWLYHLGKAFPNEKNEIHKSGMLGTEKEGLTFLKAKAKDSEMWSLLCTSLLSQAKLGLQNGESIAIVFENLVKASHLSVTKNVTNITGSLLMMQASVFSRLGVEHLSWSYADTFLISYKDEAQVDDVLRCNCWMAHLLAQKGRYKEAMSRMDKISPETFRTLKYNQYWTYFTRLLKLRRQLYRDNMVAVSHILSLLRASDPPDGEISLAFSLLHIEYLIQMGDHSEAMRVLESTADSYVTTDVYARIRLLNLKCRIFEKSHQSPKAFSIAMRAVSIAYRSRLLPALWDSIIALAVVLISLSEFGAAVQILEAIIPQVYECEDCALSAHIYTALVDANMGLAGGETTGSPSGLSGISTGRKEHMTKAVEYLDIAYGEYELLEDVKGMCECLAKKATILHLLGELLLANDCSAEYLSVKARAKAERE